MFRELFSIIPVDPSIGQGMLALVTQHEVFAWACMLTMFIVFGFLSCICLYNMGRCPRCGSRRNHVERYRKGRGLAVWFEERVCNNCNACLSLEPIRFEVVRHK